MWQRAQRRFASDCFAPDSAAVRDLDRLCVDVLLNVNRKSRKNHDRAWSLWTTFLRFVLGIHSPLRTYDNMPNDRQRLIMRCAFNMRRKHTISMKGAISSSV